MAVANLPQGNILGLVRLLAVTKYRLLPTIGKGVQLNDKLQFSADS